MSELTNSTTWSGSIDQNSMQKTYNFQTAGKYVDKNIQFQINVSGVVIPTPSTGSTEFYIEIGGVRYTWHVDTAGNVWVD